MATFANGPTDGPGCTPGRHVGDDDGGRCSACNERLTARDLARVGLLLAALSSAVVLAIVALALRWLLG